MKLLSILSLATSSTTRANEETTAAAAGLEHKSGCTETVFANFEGGTGMISNPSMDLNQGYTHADSCRWVINSGFGVSQLLLVRFVRFDTEDSKKCDSNPNNDWKGGNSVFEMKFKDETDSSFYHEKFCHTLGYDRWLHKNSRNGGTVRNFEGNNPKDVKVKNGENLMGWTQLDAKQVIFDFAVAPDANVQKKFKGFKIEYALDSDLELETLKSDIIAFVENSDNYPETMKQNQIKTVKKFFKQKVQKAHKQNGQKCVTMATHVPAFVKEAWASVNTMPDLAAFMSHEEEKEDKTGFKGYLDFVHGGCWKKVGVLENMARWNDKFVQWF